jgi:Trypsin-co-occurring domain 2
MKSKDYSQTSLSLKELIRRVQKELIESQREREEDGQKAIFEVEKLTLEVHFIVAQSSEGKGGIDFKILTFGGANVSGGRNYQNQQIHKIILSLKVIPDGSEPLTSPPVGVEVFPEIYGKRPEQRRKPKRYEE